MKKNWIVWCLTLCLMVTTAGQGLAFNGIATNWKNTYPDVCATLTAAANDCTLCPFHGFGLNSYAVDLNNAGLNFASIEGDDSDGDGRSNLQEITPGLHPARRCELGARRPENVGVHQGACTTSWRSSPGSSSASPGR